LRRHGFRPPHAEVAAVTEDGVADGKRVSFVELYFDLVFVFAIGQTVHGLDIHPTWRGLVATLGLFATLWWTWIGFVVLYNRRGEDAAAHRLIVLAATVPCAVAAIEVEGATEGRTGGLAVALAAARVVLAFAFAFNPEQGRSVARHISARYTASAVLFAASAFLPPVPRYALWGLALVQEAQLLASESRARAEPHLQLNSSHLAERFGLFMIILLGEIVISVGSAAAAVPRPQTGYWISLLAGLCLAATLWWIYFTSAAEIDEYVLRASGGNPATAYGLYAAGQFLPAFALVVIAAGVSLALDREPPRSAAWLITGGLAAFFAGTRAVAAVGSLRYGRLAWLAAVAATGCLALLQPWLTATGVLVLATAWAVGLAAIVTSQHAMLHGHVHADPHRFLRRR
jgi:low temperature requirement protein LtrA